MTSIIHLHEASIRRKLKSTQYIKTHPGYANTSKYYLRKCFAPSGYSIRFYTRIFKRVLFREVE